VPAAMVVIGVSLLTLGMVTVGLLLRRVHTL
jgi:hypothetical protein